MTRRLPRSRHADTILHAAYVAAAVFTGVVVVVAIYRLAGA